MRWWWRCIVISTAAITFTVGAGIAGVILYYGQLAGREDLADLGKMPQRSIVLDRNGEIIGRLHGSNRIVVSVNEVSPLFVDALIAREDSRFFHHGGIDYHGIARAMLRNIKDKKLVQGASTITMQLARNSYFGSDKTLHRKLLEAMMARRIEKHYSKRRFSPITSIAFISAPDSTVLSAPPRLTFTNRPAISRSAKRRSSPASSAPRAVFHP